MKVYALCYGSVFEGGDVEELFSTEAKAMKAAKNRLIKEKRESIRRVNYIKTECANHPAFEDQINQQTWSRYEGPLHPSKKAKWQNKNYYIEVEEWEVK